MTDNWQQDELDQDYANIVEKIRGGSLYGIPINIADMKQMVVSAYLLGQHELRVQHMSERKVSHAR